nr:MAG TPA: helix-turn-helix domain protein [Caudoviricetes sp.]
MNDKFKDVGARIREARKVQQLSQADLAERLQISTSHMSDIENGKKNIGLDIFMRLTEALQVSADWLLRTNIPSVSNIQNSEIAEILFDCSADEVQFLIKMMKEMKSGLRSKNKNNS